MNVMHAMHELNVFFKKKLRKKSAKIDSSTFTNDAKKTRPYYTNC